MPQTVCSSINKNCMPDICTELLDEKMYISNNKKSIQHFVFYIFFGRSTKFKSS